MYSQSMLFSARYKNITMDENCPWCISNSTPDSPEYVNIVASFAKYLFVSDRAFASDLMWIKTVYYFGQQCLLSGNFESLFSYLHAVLSLSNDNVYPYKFGVISLLLYAEDVAGSYDIASWGLVSFPDDWWFYFMKGYIDWKYYGKMDEAAKSFFEGSQKAGAPRFLAFIASSLSAKTNHHEMTNYFVHEALKFSRTEWERKHLLKKLEK